MLKIATWNINSIRIRLPQVLNWLAAHQPDVLAIQETKTPDDQFPIDAVNAAGYQAIYTGQKTYNGMAILSRQPGAYVVTDIPEFQDHQRRYLGMTLKHTRILNIYIPNGSSVGSEKYIYKLNWLDKLIACLEKEIQTHEHVILLGDFNIAPEDQDVHDPKYWENQVMFSESEKNAFKKIIALGFSDCLRLFTQPKKSFTWWDYRLYALRRNLGLRIDHILASNALSKYCKHVYIDKMPRAGERPSDHAPVVAVFDI